MANWPAALPQLPTPGGYKEEPSSGMVRTTMDAGPAKRRRRISAAPKKMHEVYEMTSAQLVTFEEFYNDTLLDGSLTFTKNNPRTGVSSTYAFGETKPSWSNIGPGYWLVDLDLEILP
jgi:hypothetical protein